MRGSRSEERCREETQLLESEWAKQKFTKVLPNIITQCLKQLTFVKPRLPCIYTLTLHLTVPYASHTSGTLWLSYYTRERRGREREGVGGRGGRRWVHWSCAHA